MNTATLLQRVGLGASERPALAIGTRHYASYGELAGRVAVMASNMQRRFDVRPGDRVVLLMRNSVQYIELLFACWHAGATVVPVNAKLAPKEVTFIIHDSGAKICFINEHLAHGSYPSGTAGDRRCVVLPVEDAAYPLLAVGEPMPVVPRDPADTAWLFYTSGTTGRPKGAMLSHRSLMAMTAGYFMDVDCIAPGDSIIHAAPMSHGSGLYVLPHVAAGALQVIPESQGFNPHEILQLTKAHTGVTIFGAPTMVNRLVSAFSAGSDAKNLKTLVYGGGPMYLSDCKRALECFGNKLVQIYGQGESPMTITTLSKVHHGNVTHPRYEERLASVGIRQVIAELRVLDSDDAPVVANEVGEVAVRGDSLMNGYWNNPDATAEALRNNWLHTGDLGSLDEDGFLTLKDRSKDLIVTGGSNVYPREVEEVLLQHPAVAETAVVGFPDATWGERVVAFVVARPDFTIDPAELDKLCLAHIARFKRPRMYRIVDALPKNNYGKVLKTSLRETLREFQADFF